MKTVYLDADYMCHDKYEYGYIAISTELLDTYCDAAIEAIRFIPKNCSWARDDATVIYGPFIQIQNTKAVDAAQKQSDIDNENMLPIEAVADLVELIYESDMEVIEG